MGIALLVLVVGFVMMGVEAWRPGQMWPRVAGWWARAIALNGVQVAAVFLAGKAWNGWMLRHRSWSAEGLGVVAGGILGYLAITFVYYWWHRWRHDLPLLWRWFHQVHHSPQRIEIVTSFYKHPFEIVANSILSSAIVYLAVGLGPGAAAVAVALSGLAELFYHWNVRTPVWVGYVFQRPESHRVHHQEGLHSFNYSDIPLWDMLFGTFRNPRVWNARCGFGPEGEHRLFEMLRGVDIHAATATPRVPAA
jgi:sterol desaturase/sphingolipid hydroxylase (fatty acid hydroxylase superfamily)